MWQPIDTAPTNQRIIVSESGVPPRDEVAIAWLDRADGHFYYSPVPGRIYWHPTHWMPIPDPPSSELPSEEGKNE